MGSTINYGLFVTDDSSMRFLDWRNQMNGTENSNITKIDAVLKDKADNSIPIEAVLTTDGWVGESAPFTQEIAVDGMTAEQNGTIAVSHIATSTQRASAREAMMAITLQEDGRLVISSDGKCPEVDIPVTIILLG